MRAPKVGWWLLVGSVLLNLVLLALHGQERGTTKEEALLFALDRCQGRLARYAEVKATADAYDKMLEGRWVGGSD